MQVLITEDEPTLCDAYDLIIKGVLKELEIVKSTKIHHCNTFESANDLINRFIES